MEENYSTLNLLYKEKIIIDTDLEYILDKIIINTARSEYNLMLKKSYPVDHLVYPECLVYGLEKGIKKFNFDHGDTIETFPKHYERKNLIKELKKKFSILKSKNSMWI